MRVKRRRSRLLPRATPQTPRWHSVLILVHEACVQSPLVQDEAPNLAAQKQLLVAERLVHPS